MFWCGLAAGLIIGGMIGLLVTAALVAGEEKEDECGGGSNSKDL